MERTYESSRYERVALLNALGAYYTMMGRTARRQKKDELFIKASEKNEQIPSLVICKMTEKLVMGSLWTISDGRHVGSKDEKKLFQNRAHRCSSALFTPPQPTH